MKASPLLVAWHDDGAPIYSAHFEPHGKGRLATAGGDHHVRLWKLDQNGEERKVTYLSTLIKHTQAVNVVRWCPKGELLASAGDDGNILLWIPTEGPALAGAFGEENADDLEHWRVKTMCRSSSGSEIYDLAWSPDGTFFITGSMDNVARIYNATTGTTVRQIAEHNHYVQGVAWDPLNEYIATQSSDRSVHIYSLKTKDGQPSLAQHNKVAKMDLPSRRISASSPALTEVSNPRSSFVQEALSEAFGSPKPSAPGTPQSLPLPMNPPPTSHSRRSSFGSQMGQQSRRSVSPSPSMPLPAVMPSASPALSALGVKNASIYANETFTSFFRRLTFAPDGSLLFTPAGQFKNSQPAGVDAGKSSDDIINTVYIYTRAGLNKPPVAYLPGHKKPSLAVKCSPVYYTLRAVQADTKEITIDTGSADDIPVLPEPAIPSKAPISHAAMEPPPLTGAPSPAQSAATATSPRTTLDAEPSPTSSSLPPGPNPVFNLPYRIVYAVATQDAVHVYDTQQQKPLCVVSNLHYATFTDLSWSSDGLTLLITSSDGFCSALTFSPGELGSIYQQPTSRHTPGPISIQAANSTASTPQQTPTASQGGPTVPGLSRAPSSQGILPMMTIPSPGFAGGRPSSPARSMSASSIATEASFARAPDQNAPPTMNYPTPSLSAMPSVAAAGSSLPLFTPPQTPGHHANGSTSSLGGVAASVNRPGDLLESAGAGMKRLSDATESQLGDERGGKKRRVAPTLLSADVSETQSQPPPAGAPSKTEG